MQPRRLHVQNRAAPGRAVTARLLGNERQRRTFVEQPQLAVGTLVVRRIVKDAAREQVTVKIGHQRTGIAQRQIWAAIFALQPPGILLHADGPLTLIALVHAVILGLVRDADVRVRKQKFADAGVERKPVDAPPRGIDQHRARPVDDIPRGHQVAPPLQHIVERARSAVRRLTPVDSEDRPHTNVKVNVGRAVQRVIQQHILARGKTLRDGDEVLLLLRSHRRQPSGVVIKLKDRALGKAVQLLHHLALHILIPRTAQNTDQPCPRGSTGDDLARQRHVIQQPGQYPRRIGEVLLLVEHKAVDGDDLVGMRSGQIVHAV